MNKQWLLSTVCGVGLLVSTTAFAQSTKGGSKSTDADHSADQLNARELATPMANPGS